MTALLQIRDNLRNFYSRNEIYLLPFLKFVFAFIMLLFVNSSLGYMSKLNSSLIVLVLALLCSFMPMNILVIISGILCLLHLYSVSLECAIVTAACFLLMFLLYYRFAPKDTLVVLLLPVFIILKIPFVIPIVVGLLCPITSAVSVACGVVVYYVLSYMKENITVITSLEADNAIAKFRYIIDGLLANKGMVVVIISFAATTIVVYLIRRLSVDHAWTIAMVTGVIVSVVILLMGDLRYDTNISVASTIIGAIVSVLLAKIVQFFAFNVDYTRTEYVQFEDDEYYYYVKAVPKNSVSKAKRTVKKITSVL